MARIGQQRHRAGDHAVCGLEHDVAEIEPDPDCERAAEIGGGMSVAMPMPVAVAVTVFGDVLIAVVLRWHAGSRDGKDPSAYSPCGCAVNVRL